MLGVENLFYLKSIETHARTFLTHNILYMGTALCEGTDDTFDFCTSCVEGSRDLFNQLLDSTPRGKFGNIGKH